MEADTAWAQFVNCLSLNTKLVQRPVELEHSLHVSTHHAKSQHHGSVPCVVKVDWSWGEFIMRLGVLSCVVMGYRFHIICNCVVNSYVVYNYLFSYVLYLL